MFDQIFLSPQMKQSMIISNKHGIYGLPQELMSDLRLIRKYLPKDKLPANNQDYKHDLRLLDHAMEGHMTQHEV